MDIAWMAALAALWGLAAGLVVGLDRLNPLGPAAGAPAASAPGARP